jgi:hypothetical protein
LKLGRSQIAEAAIRGPHGRRTHRGGVCLSTLYNPVVSVCLYQEANSQLRASLVSIVDKKILALFCSLLYNDGVHRKAEPWVWHVQEPKN